MTTSAPRGVERALARKREKYEDEVARLTAAALAVMQERDTVDPRVSDILDHAGLSTAAMYRHFPTKDDLLLALIEGAGANTRSYIAHQLERIDDPRLRIVTWVESMFDLLGDPALLTRNRPFLLAHPRLLEQFPAEIGQMVNLLVEPLTEAIAAARQQADLDAGTAASEAALVYHLVFGLLIDRAAQRRTVDRALVDTVVRHCLRAVLSPEHELPRREDAPFLSDAPRDEPDAARPPAHAFTFWMIAWLRAGLCRRSSNTPMSTPRCQVARRARATISPEHRPETGRT